MPEIIAKTRYASTSPRKLRAVAYLVKNQSAEDSLITLKYTPKKAAGLLSKTIKTAIYNAVNNFNYDKSTLTVKNILIDQGPCTTRYRAMARSAGSAYKIKTSHITVILEAPEAPTPKRTTKTTKKDTGIKPASQETKPKTTPSKTQEDNKPKADKTTVSVRSRKK